MNTKNEKELEIVVYEPVRRSDINLPQIKEESTKTKEFSGLYNRGNTCYLNSLIQILFLTPEFRNNILSWKYIESMHGKPQDCIPFQLQKLFARMKLRCRDSEATEGLTKSFQWDHHQLLEQHDIQELCRVLFEAIEMSLSEIEGNFIIDLFQGCSISVVKCLKCLKESVKKDYFMDISLPIRNEYDKIYNTSLEMAFVNFLKEEKLCGSEQYFCEKCDVKVDALKFLKFTKLPKILFLQMNRFEYDIETEGRKKICDRVTFPLILNMNPFVKDYTEIKEEFTKEKFKLFEKRDDIFSNHMSNEELISDKLVEMREQYIKEGEYVYELYAVVVHSGSARSGHYYSYIKSNENNKWYRFEDSTVFEASIYSIERTFGENNSCGPTGYILMYKQLMNDSSISIKDISIEENKELFEAIQNENIIYREDEEKQKQKLNSLQLKFIFDDNIANVIVRRSDTLSELKSRVLKEFKLNDTIDLKNVRLRLINPHSFKMQEAFEDESKSLDDSNIVPNKTYTLEIKNHNENFEEFDPNLIYLNVCLWHSEYIDFEEKNFKFEKIKFNSKKNLNEFKQLLYTHFKIEDDIELQFFKKLDYASNNYTITNIFKEEDLSKELDKLNLTENSKLYLEIKSADIKNSESQFIKYFENNCSNVIVKFNSPVETNLKTQDLNLKSDFKIKNKKISKITFSSYKFDLQLEIKKSKTLKELKSRISQALSIDDDKFIIKKNTHNGVELKSLSETIDKYSTSTINIYVEYGNPQKDTEIKINLFTCEYDCSIFMIYPYKLVDRGLFTADLSWTIDELKRNFIIELAKKKIDIYRSDEDKVEEFLLREYKNDRPAKIYQNGMLIGKDLLFVENKKMILQKYIESKIEYITINTQNSFQVSVREWDPSNWIVHTPIEIHLTKGASFLEIASVLVTFFAHIEIHNISATKITNEINLYMDDIKKLKFDNLYENCDYVIDKFPFFISSDGFMLLIKDDSKVPRDPTEEEIRLLCRPKALNSKMRNAVPIASVANGNVLQSTVKSNESKFPSVKKYSGGVVRNKIKEKGIIIKVKNEVSQNSVDKAKVDINGIANDHQEQSNADVNGDCLNECILHEDVNGKVEKNAIEKKKFQIEIQNKEFNNGNNSNIDLSEYDEVIYEQDSQNLYHNKNINK